MALNEKEIFDIGDEESYKNGHRTEFNVKSKPFIIKMLVLDNWFIKLID